MKKLIVLFSSLAALAIAGVAGASGAESADAARAGTTPTGELELEWGTGAQPRYVASSSGVNGFPQSSPRSGPLFELRWGDGGPPELVRIDAQ